VACEVERYDVLDVRCAANHYASFTVESQGDTAMILSLGLVSVLVSFVSRMVLIAIFLL